MSKEINDAEATMLAELPKLIVTRLSAAIEDVHKYYKTFPELASVMSIIIDVSVCDTNLIQVISGSTKFVKPRLKDLQENAK